MPDFSNLLAKPTAEIKEPKPLPVGTYMGLLTKKEYREVDTPKDTETPKKPVVSFTVRLDEAMEDVDQADLNEALDGQALSSKTMRPYDMWLTNDAQYRVVELGNSMGLQADTLGELIESMVNQPVLVSLDKVQDRKNPDRWFTNITKLVGTVEQAA
jgi:hypothetical protein